MWIVQLSAQRKAQRRISVDVPKSSLNQQPNQTQETSALLLLFAYHLIHYRTVLRPHVTAVLLPLGAITRKQCHGRRWMHCTEEFVPDNWNVFPLTFKLLAKKCKWTTKGLMQARRSQWDVGFIKKERICIIWYSGVEYVCRSQGIHRGVLNS